EFTGPLKDADFWKDIADHVLDDILSTYMQRHLPVAHALLQFFGIICYEEVNNQAGLKTYYVKAIVDWDQLVKVVTNPLQAFKDFYHWDQENQSFQHRKFLRNLNHALESLKVHSTVLVPSGDFLNITEFNPSPAYNIEEEVMEWYLPFLYGMLLTD